MSNLPQRLYSNDGAIVELCDDPVTEGTAAMTMR
jgi:hypothetical protein